MNEKDIVLSVKNLNTSFISDRKEIKIVKNVSLDLKRATTLAIVGESGCGKSVTVHSIVKLMPKNARVKADYILYNQKRGDKITEFDLSKLEPYGKEMRALRGPDIGMVFQDPMSSLNPVYKVGDQVAEGLLEHNPKMSKEEAKEQVLAMFRELGIPDPENRINDFPYQFSGGMKQRVVIALAMICNPEIIIADEPTTALDVTIQAQIMELMKSLQTEKNKSIILITHNMGLVAEMADEVCVMYMGRIVEFGTLEHIFNNPSHPYTKALLRSVPVLGMEEGRLLETIPGITPNPAELKEGCEFADRCPDCRDECRKGTIPAFEVEPGHKVRCLNFNSFKEVD
ncbi:MAG: ABC transporter ATP-binding protein [Christensenellaceae bacterium]|nr:ABC transporter ATP-binding protein [Christensenellaceae bacterium]